MPRRALTPGAVLPVAVDELCRTTGVANDPPVNPTIQQAVFKEYGLANLSGIGYALDYLITPALGGSGDIKNLWPQPSSSTWNARVKDQLEDHLHELVCQGKVQLTTAQNEIATDWISAYKRYFNTDKPQPGNACRDRQEAQTPRRSAEVGEQAGERSSRLQPWRKWHARLRATAAEHALRRYFFCRSGRLPHCRKFAAAANTGLFLPIVKLWIPINTSARNEVQLGQGDLR